MSDVVQELVRCAVCRSGVDLVRVRERRPGSTGRMPSSFWAEYGLCRVCLELCASVGAIDVAGTAGEKMRDRSDAVVFAKTLRWLKLIKERESK